MNGRLLRVKEVCARCGFSKSTLWTMVAEGAFPQPVHISVRCTRWLEEEIDAWKAALIEKRNAGFTPKPQGSCKGGEYAQAQRTA